MTYRGRNACRRAHKQAKKAKELRSAILAAVPMLRPAGAGIEDEVDSDGNVITTIGERPRQREIIVSSHTGFGAVVRAKLYARANYLRLENGATLRWFSWSPSPR